MKRLKSEVCKEIKASVFIEDSLIHSDEVAKNGVPTLLPDRPWNQDFTPEGMTRVTSRAEIIS